MSEKQPTALRLADVLDECKYVDVYRCKHAALELRRLHAENEALRATQATKELWDEIIELDDTVALLRDELSDMVRTSFSQIEVMRQAVTALEDVIKAHGYESGTPVEAVAALRERLGERT